MVHAWWTNIDINIILYYFMLIIISNDNVMKLLEREESVISNWLYRKFCAMFDSYK